MIGSRMLKHRPVKDWTANRVLKNRNGVFHLTEDARSFYHGILQMLIRNDVPFLLGGAYAFGHYTGISRHTKDLDIFVRPKDCEPLLDLAARNGFRTEITFRHWIGKIWNPADELIDVIYGSGNGICEVDEEWFRHAVPGEFLGLPVRVVPCEEMIWSKGYILERNRFDGADIAHLIRAQGPLLDWNRLIERFGDHWRVLYAHMILYGFVYPDEPHQIPRDVLLLLNDRLRASTTERPRPAKRRLCQGTLFSHSQYKKDLDDWGYKDARLRPHGKMTEEDIRQWTAAFASEKP
jgi:hypothetical protein